MTDNEYGRGFEREFFDAGATRDDSTAQAGARAIAMIPTAATASMLSAETPPCDHRIRSKSVNLAPASRCSIGRPAASARRGIPPEFMYILRAWEMTDKLLVA
jgi:hypothetical protein